MMLKKLLNLLYGRNDAQETIESVVWAPLALANPVRRHTSPMMAAMPASSTGAATQNPLAGRRIAFTTPLTYSPRLSHLLDLRGATSLPIPTVTVTPTTRTLAALEPYLRPAALDPYSALAFTSRNGISALADILTSTSSPPLSDSGDPFTVAALGRDAELLFEANFLARLCCNPSRIRILVPQTPSPIGLVESLGEGGGRRVLCPVPVVVDLEEPPVVPEFIAGLEAAGWNAVRVPAYETRWAGPGCVRGLVESEGTVDAVVFTSTAEVEGLMKGLEAVGWDWRRVRERWPEMVVGAHGPVTKKGAGTFGVEVDVVSLRFGSFDGVIEALASWWGDSAAER